MGTWIVGIVVFGVIAVAAYQIYRDYKNGKGCGCGCENCSGCGSQSEDKKEME